MASKLTENERTMLMAVAAVHPKKLCFTYPANQDIACRLDGMGLLAVYERGNSDGEIYVTITDAGRAALGERQ